MAGLNLNVAKDELNAKCIKKCLIKAIINVMQQTCQEVASDGKEQEPEVVF